MITLQAPPIGNQRFAAVLVDLDGTLVDSGDAVDRAWRHWCAEHGVADEEIHSLIQGRTALDVIRTVRPTWSASTAARAAWRQLLLQEEDPAPGTPVPGAGSLLAGLPADRRWAIVTACSARLARHRLRSAGLPEPPTLVSVEDVENGKPHPEPYLVAAGRLGVDPRECLAIEDAPAGVWSARAAGCRVVAVTTTHQPDDLREATVVVDRLDEVRFGSPQVDQ